VLPILHVFSKKLDLIKERVKRLDQHGVIYTFVNFFIYGLYFVRALVIPKILDSYSYGIFSVFNLFLKFSTIFDMGSISYLQKEVAINLHAKNAYDNKLERQVVFLNIVLVLVSTFFFLLVNRDIADKIHFLDYVFWILIAVFSQLYVIKTGILRSLEKFKLLSKVLVANALLTIVIISFFFLDVRNIYLIYLVYLLSMLLPVVFFAAKFNVGSLFPFRFLAHSWPIFLYNILVYLYVNIDKFIIKDIYSFLEFSTYSLYSAITTSVFMAVSLLWSMFYSKIFSKKSDIAERLDTANAFIIFICLCMLKFLYPVFGHLFPDYAENFQFFNVSLQYAALACFLPNSLIKYLNNRKALFSVCSILVLHSVLIVLLKDSSNFLRLLPFLSWGSYFLIEILGVRSHNKLLFLARVLLSILVVLVCIL
jgi:hypothetical protein